MSENVIDWNSCLQKVFGHTLERLWKRRSGRRNHQLFTANRLRRHKSFSCPHLLISDLSVPPQHEAKLNINGDQYSHTELLEPNLINNKTDDSVLVETTERLKDRLSLLQPRTLHRRLSVSLPKDIDRLSSFKRKMGTVSKPYQADIFEQNENEFCPMIEKYRQ